MQEHESIIEPQSQHQRPQTRPASRAAKPVLSIRAAIAGALSIALLCAGCQPQHNSTDNSAQPVIAASTEGADVAKPDPTKTDASKPYYNPHFENQDAGGIPILSDVGKAIGDTFVAIGNGIVGAFQWLGGDRPTNAVRMMEDGSSADNRRQGINKLLQYDFTKADPYTKRYRQIGQLDPDPTVRATAIRASNRARDPKATALFIKSLDDKSEWVRLEAAKALVNIPDTAAVPALLRTLNNADENRDVRIAAADALKHYRTLTVARALVGVLSDRDFAVCWQARKSLQYLFNKDLGYSASAWLTYLTGPQSPVK